jgi:hypothetical protein
MINRIEKQRKPPKCENAKKCQQPIRAWFTKERCFSFIALLPIFPAALRKKMAESGTQPALPRLVEFDWRADVKTASDEQPRMAAPSLIVSLKVWWFGCKNLLVLCCVPPIAGKTHKTKKIAQVQPTPTHVGETTPPTPVTFELGRETLDVMLEGLGRIRDQLKSVRGS